MIKSSSLLSESDRNSLAQLLFPSWRSLSTVEELEARYPQRKLPADALVTRVAPSPTGFAHIGLVYASLVNRKLAHQSEGIFILRIEDTDSKREVQGAIDTIVNALVSFDLRPDEGFVPADTGGFKELGAYGPYLQSPRRETFQGCAFELVKRGLAYPCFCSAAELEAMSVTQTGMKVRTGYYGEWARWRDRSVEEVKAELAQNKAFVIRLRAWGLPQQRVSWKDGIKGLVSMPENDLDAVILKSDGQSLYHFAHALDDHFMRITQVIRGDEWLSSVPLHIQIFEAFGWKHPEYAHLAPIQKIEITTERDPETGAELTKESRRKLSKRKDPEANVLYYLEQGYAADAVVEYLLNIANSDFEDWRRQNGEKHYREFTLKINKQSVSGAVADELKLANISRDVISRMDVETLYALGLQWALKHDNALANLMQSDPVYTKASLNIERAGKKASKRITTWKDLHAQLAWFFDQEFAKVTEFPFPAHVTPEIRSQILQAFMQSYEPADTREIWFEKCKPIASQVGYASEMKEFKNNPGRYVGHVGDVTMVIRVALSGLQQTPELCEVMKVLGKARINARLRRHLNTK